MKSKTAPQEWPNKQHLFIMNGNNSICLKFDSLIYHIGSCFIPSCLVSDLKCDKSCRMQCSSAKRIEIKKKQVVNVLCYFSTTAHGSVIKDFFFFLLLVIECFFDIVQLFEPEHCSCTGRRGH